MVNNKNNNGKNSLLVCASVVILGINGPGHVVVILGINKSHWGHEIMVINLIIIGCKSTESDVKGILRKFI